jgi:hypothetical protein
MSLIGLIDNIPLYTTIEEAGIWGSQYGLEVVTSLATGDVEPGTTVTTGYHTHYIQGSQGFMAGDNHDIVMEAMVSGVQSFLSAEQLSQGEFVVTTAERDAYASLVQEEENVAPTTATFVNDPNLTVTVQPVIIESNTPGPTVVTTPTPSGGSYSGGGY